MRYFLLSLIVVFSSVAASADQHQHEITRVLTVGSFHFNFPNLDVQTIDSSHQIDVLTADNQQQITQIAQQLMAFKPTHIVVEYPFEHQKKVNKQYDQYLADDAFISSRRSEVYQLGFRIAKRLGHKNIYAADTWGKMYNTVSKALDDEQQESAFGRFYKNNHDTTLRFEREPVFKSQSIMAELRQLNAEQTIEKTLGNYLIGQFKYETDSSPFFGADFETGRWFNRNLRIFRNIQRVPEAPERRILVIFGAGHMNLLNLFFDASPEYERESVTNYLDVQPQ